MTDQQLNAGRTYQAVEITTSSTPRIVLMLYEGALRFAALAKKHVTNGCKREAYKYKGKLLNVLSELTRSLVIVPESKEAYSFLFVYQYMSKVVRETKVEAGQTSGFDEVLRILGDLRNSWRRMLAENGIA